MKFSPVIRGFVVVGLAATALAAQAEKPKTIKVVGLEDDSENTTVAAPAELGKKPQTVAISADALVEKAQTSGAVAEPSLKDANVKALTIEGMVIPPSAERAKTLEEAVRDIVVQAGKQIGAVSSNGIEKLVMPYHQLGDGKSYEVEWRKALRLLLSPVGYNFTEDSELVLFGLAEEVDIKHKQLAQERLTSNRTPILFTTNEAEGGMELRNAIRDVAVKADVTITTDYMEPGDLFVPVQTAASEGKLTADDIGKAKEKSTVQQHQVKRTSFDTNGQQIEWRIVLREILNPHDYDFVEVGGVVRIAKRAKLAQWDKEAVAKKPLAARVIRLYHADPEAVVERVMKIKDLLKHPNASLQATRKKDDNTEVVKNLNSRIQTSSGQRSGQSDTTSQVFDKLIRPRTVPAIIAYDLEENMDAIEEKIKLFDIKEKQVLIEAIIFQLDSANGGGDMDGILWSGFEDITAMYGSLGNVGSIASTFPGMFNTVEKTVSQIVPVSSSTAENGATTTQYEQRDTTVTSSKSKGMYGLYDGRRVWMKSGYLDFRATIQMIREKSNSKLLASPMLVVGDHSEAAIQVSDVDPVPQIEASTVSSTAGFDSNVNIQWNMIRSGVLMWVSPEITETGSSVRLTVHPQVVIKGDKVDLSQIDTAGSKFKEYPVYNYELKMQEMDTRATVPSGATLMFGGLVNNREEEVENKVRWLGDLPIIGWLFRSKTKTVVQQNLIIMIRPTILEDNDRTGFEKNALKEAESVSANSGRNLKKAPMEGPYTYKETKQNLKDFYEERVVKPFKEEGASTNAVPAAVPATDTPVVSVPAVDVSSAAAPAAQAPDGGDASSLSVADLVVEEKAAGVTLDDKKPDEKKPNDVKSDDK